MELGLASKTAIVTGASIGIGRAIAEGLAAEGVRIVAVARRTDLLDQLVNDVGGGLITPFAQDVMARDAAENIAAFAQKTLGHVDILVNNAGGSRPLPVDAPDEKWDEAIALNFTSYRRIAHALLPQMIARKWGLAEGDPAAHAAAHLFQRAFGEADESHAMMDAARTEPALRDLEAAAFAE